MEFRRCMYGWRGVFRLATQCHRDCCRILLSVPIRSADFVLFSALLRGHSSKNCCFKIRICINGFDRFWLSVQRLLDSTNEWFTNRKWCSFSIIFTANISVADIAEVRVASPGLCLMAWSRCSREAIVCGGGVSRTTSVTVGDLEDLHKTWICLSHFLKSLFYLVADTSPVWWRRRDLTNSSYFWRYHACIGIYYKFLYSQNQNYIYF